MQFPSTTATFVFVDRVEEMEHIDDALKAAKDGKGQLLIIRGEAGSGKTRLIQEAINRAKERGFSAVFGTALSESVTPYHSWHEVLKGLGLEAILKEAPLPKLLGIVCFTSKGEARVKVYRKGEDYESLHRDTSIAKSVRDLISKRRKNDEETVLDSHNQYRLVIEHRSAFYLAAILEGREDEIFLADMKELAKTVESILNDKKKKGEVDIAVKARLRQLIESEKYEGIDYTKDDPKLRQERFFELVTLGLSRKADNQSLCIAIDDLQWADPSSLALLQYVSRNTRKSGVLLLGTYRIEEAEARPHLKKVLEGVQQEELLDEMDLKGLSRKDLPDLAESFIGVHDLHDDFLDLLWRETQGNPLFVREVLKGLEEEGAISIHGAVKRLIRPLDQLAIPDRVREVIRVRLKRLPEGDRRLLDAAATCGTRFTAALVAKVAGEEEIKVLNGLRAIAKVHGLLRPVDSSFTFDHPAVQEVLYDGVPIEIRRNYHKEAAEWLELAGGPIEDIGEHYYRARDPRALPILSNAATEAQAKYANEEAIRFYSESLEFEKDGPGRGKILVAIGEIYRMIGDYDKGIDSYGKAMKYAQGDRTKARIKIEIGHVNRLKGNYSISLQNCIEAYNLVRDSECEEEAGSLNEIGLVLLSKGEHKNAQKYFEKCLRISERINYRKGIESSNHNLGIVYKLRGEYHRAVEFFEKSLPIKDESGDQFHVAIYLHNLGSIYSRRGNFYKSQEFYNKSLGIFKKIGSQMGISASLSNIGNDYESKGEFDKAINCYEKSLEISHRIGYEINYSSVLSNMGLIYIKRGEYEKAIENFNECLYRAEKMGNLLLISESYCNIGLLFGLKGNYDKALEYHNKGLKIAEKIDDQEKMACALNRIGSEYCRNKEYDKALNYCNQANKISVRIGFKELIVESTNNLGVIYREKKMWKESIENFERIISVLEKSGMVYHVAEAHYEFGLMWKQKGEPSKAGEHLKLAIELFNKMNLKKDLETAKEAYESLAEGHPSKLPS